MGDPPGRRRRRRPLGRWVHRAPAVLLVVLLATAGCSAPLGPATEAPDRSTLTPVSVPETTERTAVASEVAPGVTADGVRSPDRLGTAHARVLAGTSYTANRTVIRRDREGAVVGRTRTVVRVSADPGRFRYELELREGERRRVERYGDGERVYERETTTNGTRAAVVRGPDGEPLDPRTVSFGDASNRRGIVQLFVRFPFQVTDSVMRNGTTYYRLATSEPRALPPARNITATALVSERGLVRNYTITYRVQRGEQPTTVRVESRFTDVGATTVEPPAWYPAAPNGTDEPTAEAGS